ncbi:MAG TPA: PIG-L deacetylase family protein [Verrucomicrobiae bacterium]|nr:PIG-L deacetylase family protein [Verrucomicrobiae bacterium]
MNVLVIAPHPDDESIGCGGALCLHARRGDRVAAVFLTSGELGLKRLPREKARAFRESEARKAAKILKLADLFFLRCGDWNLNAEISRAAALLRPILKRVKPRLIYLPHPQEWHPDHQAALPIVRAALRRCGIPRPALRAYEIWSPLVAHDHVEDISSVMARKLEAVRAHKSQLREFDYVRAIIGLNQYRGAIAARAPYAEVFMELPPTGKSG